MNCLLPLICEYLGQRRQVYFSEGNCDHAHKDGRNVGIEGKEFRGVSSALPIDNDEVAITSGARNEYSAPPDSFVQEVLLL